MHPTESPQPIPNDSQIYNAHPQLTHEEMLHSSRTTLPQDPQSHAEILDQGEMPSLGDLHFPLHFSRVDGTQQQHEFQPGGEPLTSSQANIELSSLSGGGRDFLMPMLQPLADAHSLGDVGPSPASDLYQRPHEYRTSLTSGDKLIEPFVAASVPCDLDGLEQDERLRLPPQTTARSSTMIITDSHEDEVSSAGPSTVAIREAYPDLNDNAIQLFRYFRDTQSTVMSVSPLNYFRSVFLAFSLRYRAIMYGILAWAAWHQGNQEEIAKRYFDRASKLIKNETFNSRSKEEILAALLVMASAKVCSGDTTDWRPYLLLAGETIHVHGGLMSFMQSESVRWLLKNYAYHEILASSSLDMPRLFSANDFEIIFDQPSSESLPDTLCACCQAIFVNLERINELTRAVRLLLLSNREGMQGFSYETSKLPTPQPVSEPSEEEVERLYTLAHELEMKIWSLEPSSKILQNLSEDDLRLQLALFNVFKLVAILHLYQSVLRINSSSFSMRIVTHKLHRSIDELFGTMVEGILIFPLFILGIATTSPETRQYVEDRFTGMANRLSARNVKQALLLVQKVWSRDNYGQNHVDWNELVDREGLHFCFA